MARHASHRLARGLRGVAFGILLAACWGIVGLRSGLAYVEIPYTLGRVVQESTSITLLRVERVEKEKNLILFRKVQDVKGKTTADVVRHNIGRGGFHEREWKSIMEWAEPGKTALFFNNGGASETCIHNYWYQAYAGGEWWNMSHGEPYMLRSFAGNPEKLASIVTAMLAGQEVIAPCMVDGDKMALQTRTAKIQRLRASLKIQDYNAQRDFVGYGGDDFRALAGMPGFAQMGSASRVDPEAGGVSVADVDGDGRLDFCFYGLGKVGLFKIDGNSLGEMSVPITGGARSAEWGDYNGDGKPDLLLATPTGPKLLTNQAGVLKDDSAILPKEGYYQLAAAAWIDYDGDKLPDILLANGFLGLRLYRNLGPAGAAQNPPKAFEDVTALAKLAATPTSAAASSVKGDHLAVADVNGDGRSDFLYSAGTGQLFLNTPQGFVLSADSGIQYQAGKVRPFFADFNGDKQPDLFVPQNGVCKLLLNRAGKFADVAAQKGDLAKALGDANCAAWADFDQDGHADLFVGCLRGANRFLRGKPDGTFTDETEKVGFYQRVFNTRGISLADVNRDGALDLLLNNEGQDPLVLLGAARPAAGQVGQAALPGARDGK